HAEGSVDDEHAAFGTPRLAPDPRREVREYAALKYPPIELDAERRFVTDATIREVCEYRKWKLHAVHARSTHVHAVVNAVHASERVMNDFKGYATRRMREAKVLGPDVEPWSHHGSTRYLNTENSLFRVVQYVLNEQGGLLDM